MEENREFLKSKLWDAVFYSGKTDQKRNIPHPPVQKEYPTDVNLIDLVAPEKFTVGKIPVIEAIRRRKSRRKFSEELLNLEELSFLLWVAQGVHEVQRDGSVTKRTVPSAGSRHPFETYLVVNRVEGLDSGFYRYLALEHKLYQIQSEGNLAEQVGIACHNQKFIGQSAVTFVWAVIPYRSEWRYDKLAHKMIAIDAGHLCQNLYLACESIKAGICAIGAYDQEKMDKLLGFDGKDEFIIYLAAVGKIGK
ncbi:MAG: SagB/ThcOx family dehydrogenase [Candidatus Heimdallarchaeota archaeon]